MLAFQADGSGSIPGSDIKIFKNTIIFKCLHSLLNFFLFKYSFKYIFLNYGYKAI